ncbi:MAG: cation diffusion facilitator family transporter [Bacteroidota bacterium]|nr:cation diffusion facilitator family transporter [Bacteroidota bacterium]
MADRENKIKQASWVSIIGNAVLSVLKIMIGFLANSMAVIADGIDSASDILASVVTLIAAKIISKPPDPEYPFGYIKADTIATKVLSFIIFFAGAQLAISSITLLIENETREIPTMIAIWVTLFSIAGKLSLAWYQRRIGIKTESSMLKANARNMQNDVLISGSVLLGLVFTLIFELPILDTLTALLVSVYIMYSAFKIFMEANLELMDGVDDKEVYNQIFKAVGEINGAHKPHRVRTRKMGKYYIIGIDIEVDGNISVNESHKIAQRVEDNIKKFVHNVYDVLVHIEPFGKDHEAEPFGVSEEHMK